MTSWTTARTETRKARDVAPGDHIIDPGVPGPRRVARRMLTVWAVEDLGAYGLILHGTLSRNVARRVQPHQDIEVCTPSERVR